jgi:hypothetical protein
MSRILFILLSLVVGGLLFLACDPETGGGGTLPDKVVISVVRISPDFAADRTIFLGTVGSGLFRSVDGGASWKMTIDNLGLIPVEPSNSGIPVVDIAVSPTFSEDQEVFLGTEFGLYHSKDRGNIWTLLEETPFDRTVQITIAPKYYQVGVLFVTATARTGGDATYLWRSKNSGDSWENLWQPDMVQVLNDGSIIGATPRWVSLSTDMGDTESVLFTAESLGYSFGALRLSSASFSPNFQEDGIAFFGDNTDHRNVLRYDSLRGDLLDLGFRAAHRSTEVCHRTGYGEGCAIPVALSSSFSEDGTAFASAYYESEHRPLLLRSTDRGITWEELALPSDDWVISIDISPDFASDHTLVVATRHGAFLSTDGGDSWKRLGD